MTLSRTLETSDARDTRDAHSKRRSLRWPVIGTLVAIAATTVLDAAVGHAAGVSTYGAGILVLFLFLLFWYLQRFSRSAIGLTWGRWRDYALAVCYPTVVLALAGLIAWLSGAVNLAAPDWAPIVSGLVVVILVHSFGAIVTEDGFFRGWLWASLQRAGVTQGGLLVWTSVAFAAWNVPLALLGADFHLPIAQVPIFLVNVALIGLNWALMRQRSGSIVVVSVSHGIWNGLVYTLFGEGTVPGVLGIHSTGVFGPEVGLVGLALNAAFAAVVWLGFARSRSITAADSKEH